MIQVDEYIRIALNKAGGNKTRARQALAAAAKNDAELAHALALPHLESISAHALDRYMRVNNIADRPGLAAEPVKPVEPEKPVAKEAAAIPPTEASDDHRAAVLAMVAAFNKKKD